MIRDLTLPDALIVCADMRPEDAACVRAVSGREPGEWFAVDRWSSNGPAWTVMQGGQPWAIGGLTLSTEWSGVVWCVARPGLTRASWKEGLRLTRVVLERAQEGRHRIEAHVLYGWNQASRLVDHLGFELEGIRTRAGSKGESIEMWALTNKVASAVHNRASEVAT